MSYRRKERTYTDLVTCPNEDCGEDVEVTFSPGHKAQTYGRPEDCYPGDPDEIDCPEECQKCGERFTDRDKNRWIENLSEDYRERRDDRY